MQAGENDAHFYHNREQLRVQLREALGGNDEGPKKFKKLKDIFVKCDPQRTGGISWPVFKKELDLLGWSVMYQDAKDLMKAIDTDRNKKISFMELKKFVVCQLSFSITKKVAC